MRSTPQAWFTGMVHRHGSQAEWPLGGQTVGFHSAARQRRTSRERVRSAHGANWNCPGMKYPPSQDDNARSANYFRA